jgi:hypothetical protein
MMMPGNEGKRIVRSWSGPGTSTGECYYETEDGRIWHKPLVMPDYSNYTAPPRLGTIFGNRIY